MTTYVAKIAELFAFDGKVVNAEPFGSGHINETLLLTTDKGSQFILQKINTHVFPNPQELMENIFRVTEFLKKRLTEAGRDPRREALSFVKTLDGNLYLPAKKCAWRAYRFHDELIALNTCRNANDFYESGKAFGRFQALLDNYPADTLYETIPDFHNTPFRYAQLHEAIKNDAAGRLVLVKKEVEFALAREKDASIIMDLQEKEILPLRVTHNDAKLNNVLLDPETGEGVCVIDLDTIMPGQAIFDFGDSIRFGASTAAEDEKDLSKVKLDLDLFDAYTKGFLEGCNNVLTDVEKDLLPTGAWMMTLECGIRFLADYLNGDTYFKIHYPEQNLDRARTQLKLVQEMEQKQDQMQAIIAKY